MTSEFNKMPRKGRFCFLRKGMTGSQIKDYRDYAWKYFSIHTGHRLKAFNIFVVFSTVLIGAFATLVEKSGLQKPFILLPLALTFVSFLFWKLEERTGMLVKNGGEAIVRRQNIWDTLGKKSRCTLLHR